MNYKIVNIIYRISVGFVIKCLYITFNLRKQTWYLNLKFLQFYNLWYVWCPKYVSNNMTNCRVKVCYYVYVSWFSGETLDTEMRRLLLDNVYKHFVWFNIL